MSKSQTPKTNNDLLTAIYEQNGAQQDSIGKLQSDMSAVKKQVEYTNGKVASLMEDKIRREEREKTVAEMKLQNANAPTITAETVVVQQKWFQNEKLVGGVVAVLLAIATGIGFLAGGAK